MTLIIVIYNLVVSSEQLFRILYVSYMYSYSYIVVSVGVLCIHEKLFIGKQLSVELPKGLLISG